MPACPICATALETVRQREGVFYPCRTCDGRAMTVSQVRLVMKDRVTTQVLRLMKSARQQEQRRCPFCTKPMSIIHTAEPSLDLDICRACNAVWFDRPTYDSLPQITDETMNSIPMQATEIIAIERLKELKEREEAKCKSARRSRLLHRQTDLGKSDRDLDDRSGR